MAMTFSQTCTSPTAGSNPAIQNKIEASPQFKDGGFNRLWKSVGHVGPWTISGLRGNFLFTDNNRTPDMPLPVISGDLSGFNGAGNCLLNAIWLGHSSLLINMDGLQNSDRFRCLKKANFHCGSHTLLRRPAFDHRSVTPYGRGHYFTRPTMIISTNSSIFQAQGENNPIYRSPGGGGHSGKVGSRE